MSIRVASCDDSPPIRQLIAAWLDTAEDIELVGEATNGREAVELVREVEPDVLVLDLDMPQFDGVYAIVRIREFSNIPIIIYSGSSGDTRQRAAADAGATEFVRKPGEMPALLAAIRRVVAT